MAWSESPVRGGNVEDAEERFRTSAEQLAVRLRWLSIVVIPILSGLGLRTMRERVEALGGFLEIVGADDGGTRVRADVPRHANGD
ncbi:MAG: hypothetical protein ACREQ9_14315 [Candidatus Binatia bacterium]